MTREQGARPVTSLPPRRPWGGMGLRLRRAITVSDTPALVVLTVIVTAMAIAALIWPRLFPFSTLLVPMFLGSFWLGPRVLPWYVVYATALSCVLIADQPTITWRTVARAVVLFSIAFMIMYSSFRRTRLGVSGPMGESMFVDLRDRISKQGDLPPLPEEWLVEAELRAAGGTSYAGDFIVARYSSPSTLELVVVDVSGKGVEAGSRSLFLSGAFNGIASALPGEAFLPAANDYLLGQEWAEGFATAIHLHLDLESGEFELRKAGHPPAIWLHAGSGRWSVLDSEGPVLGVVRDAEFELVSGELRHGDALLLFTDGLVETNRRDISLGIDKLAGLGERLLQRGFEGGAAWLVSSMAQAPDDRALVVVHRR